MAEEEIKIFITERKKKPIMSEVRIHCEFNVASWHVAFWKFSIWHNIALNWTLDEILNSQNASHTLLRLKLWDVLLWVFLRNLILLCWFDLSSGQLQHLWNYIQQHLPITAFWLVFSTFLYKKFRLDIGHYVINISKSRCSFANTEPLMSIPVMRLNCFYSRTPVIPIATSILERSQRSLVVHLKATRSEHGTDCKHEHSMTQTK